MINLRRGLLSIVLLSFFVGSAQAQLIRGYGLKAGYTSSGAKYDLGGGVQESFFTERRSGFVAYAFVEWLDVSPISVITEVGYVQRGFLTVIDGRDPQNNPTGRIRLENRFNYISFAALAKLRLLSATVSPYIIGGPRLNIFLSGDPDGEGSLTSAFSSKIFGGTMGAGTEITGWLPVAFLIKGRYSFDISNSLPDVPANVYNNGIEVVVGLQL